MLHDFGVLIIYTGGTIGMLRKDREDPSSPLEPAPLNELIRILPNYDHAAQRILIGGKWIRIGTYTWPIPIDSSNITLNDWVEMARVVREHYDEYEGFVILHGTDTLAYTASALSFMLENLSKPVILTGAQIPISHPRSDAIQNILTAVEIAAAKSLSATVIPEVTVFFRDHLLRGCRTTKVSASSFSGFASPNYPPLAVIGDRINVDTAKVSYPSRYLLHIVDTLEPNIATITIFPGMSTDLLRNILLNSDLRGVVLTTFGSGNTPSSPQFLDVISDAVKKGMVIVDVTQCLSGEVVLGLYSVGANLLARGVISGMDMTLEAALTKLIVILGSESQSEVAADKVQLNLRGEQRQSIFNLHFPTGQLNGGEENAVLTVIRPMVQGFERYDASRVQQCVFHIFGLVPLNGRKGRLEFKVYLDLPSANESTPDNDAHFLGYASKTYFPALGPENVSMQVTEQVRIFVDNRHQNTLTIVNTGGTPFKWDSLHIACFADC